MLQTAKLLEPYHHRTRDVCERRSRGTSESRTTRLCRTAGSTTDGSVAPGETKELTLTIASMIFSTARLIPLNDPQQFVAAVLEFQNAQGGRQLVTVRSSVVPTIFRGKFLP